MNWLDFSASVIASITSMAWPLSLVVIVYLFRAKISELLPLLYLKHKDLEFRFDRAAEASARLPVPAEPSDPEVLTEFERLADTSPKTAILKMRTEVESALRNLAGAGGISADKSPEILIEDLKREQLMAGDAARLVDEFWHIGNAAKNDSSATFSKADARRYKSFADQIIQQAQSAAHYKVQYSHSPSMTKP